jgi:Ca-activated chloride channel homolog
MLPALQMALGQNVAEQGRVRHLVLVTDAMVGNDDAILGYLRQSEFHGVRVFPVAVGAAPNHYLISRAAELGRGFSLQVTNQDNAVEMAQRFNEKMAAPYMTDLEIDWGALKPADVVPEVLPDLYAGRPLVVMGRYEQPGKAEITLQGNLQGQAIKTGLTLALPEKAEEHDSLAPLWAGQRIRQIWNRNVGRETQQSRDEITQLGLTHQLVTRYTSFVAVEMDAKDLAKGNLRTHFVQPMMPEGIPDAAIGIGTNKQSAANSRPQAVTPVSPPPAGSLPTAAAPVPASPAPEVPQSSTERPSGNGPASGAGGGGGGGGGVEWLALAAFIAVIAGQWLSSRRKRE